MARVAERHRDRVRYERDNALCFLDGELAAETAVDDQENAVLALRVGFQQGDLPVVDDDSAAAERPAKRDAWLTQLR
jgi:hypothetical protein